MIRRTLTAYRAGRSSIAPEGGKKKPAQGGRIALGSAMETTMKPESKSPARLSPAGLTNLAGATLPLHRRE
ncbi:hypothetical protein BLAT2472_10757 [Burkholderia latens]